MPIPRSLNNHKRLRRRLGKSLRTEPSLYIYVDATGGNDSNSGRSPDEAWQTIAKVNASRFASGHYILFRRGETWSGRLQPVNSGIPGQYIQFGAYGSGAKPIIDGTGENDSFLLSAVSYYVIRDFQFQNADGGGVGYGIRLTNACNNIVLVNIDCVGTAREGIFLNGATDCQVRDCTATGCFVGLQFWGTSYDCTVSGGNFYSNDEEGLDIEDGSHDLIITGVACYTNGKAGFDTDSVVYNILYSGCRSYGNGTVVAASGNGFNVLNISAVEYQNCLSYDNVAHGIEVQANADDVKVYHCTFQGNGYRNLNLRGTNMVVENNIAYDCGWNQQIALYAGATWLSIDNNLYYRTAGAAFLAWLDPAQVVGLPAWRIAIVDEANSDFADPDFVDLVSNNFHLQVTSPAIGAGAIGTGVTTDYDGVTRGSPPDIGAYEYVA